MICDGYFLPPNILPKLMAKYHSTVILNIIKQTRKAIEDAFEQFERITVWKILWQFLGQKGRFWHCWGPKKPSSGVPNGQNCECEI